MKASEAPMKLSSENQVLTQNKKKEKPPFRPAKDDTKPFLQDPILRSDPTETEEAVLRLPKFNKPDFMSQ